MQQWVRGQSAEPALAALNRCDVAIIQHEYGIFSGRDGADVLKIACGLRIPMIVVLHTVLVTPTAHQRAILEELARSSVTVVTMTNTARQRAIEHYSIDPSKIRVIPHGAVDNRSPYSPLPAGTAPVVLTWGLLGPGKGIEWGIEAMALLDDLEPGPMYSVVGQTHPRVLEQYGETYREALAARAQDLGVRSSISFEDRYLESHELQRLVRGADVVLLPYDSREQVTSGVLIEAVTAGKPIVSTGFPHARELLSSGAGLIVDRQDPVGIALALRRILTEPGLAASMAAAANRIAPDLLWPAVAAQYRGAAADAVRDDNVLAIA
jgi:glycosyltransferase involved in cell wall biosynthesis